MTQLVFDIGKTHAKLFLLDANAQVLAQRDMANKRVVGGLYPHYDIANLWQFLLAGLVEYAQHAEIEKICVTTHGATAALVNTDQSEDFGLVLPVLDYEYPEVESLNAQYNPLRPVFSHSFSPGLPAGLNLGRQLYWLSETFPQQFQQANALLLYPQFWAWMLSGETACEITSLGCHSDLWSLEGASWSSLVNAQGWQQLFPPLKAAWENLGKLKPELQQLSGLKNCQVYVGVHDSNASFLRFKKQAGKQDFTVFSTGTWCIAMAGGVSTKHLQADKDMLANVDVFAEAIACSRFMGGREFAAICEAFHSAADAVGETDIQNIIDLAVFALPDFSGGSGPLAHKQGYFVNADGKVNGAALATLYCALMMDYQLDLLKSSGEIYIEGAFTQNPLLCALLAQLQSGRKIKTSRDSAGTVAGCAQLMNWNKKFQVELMPVQASNFNKLIAYKNAWREYLL